MILLAASDPFSGLIGLVIFVAIAAISHFLKRKQGAAGDPIPDTDTQEAPAPGRRGGITPPPAGRPLSWEEEIKRLLEGQAPVEAPAPPPLPARLEPPPVRPRREPALPPVFSRTGQSEETEAHELHDTATGHMAVMREAASAHDRASHLGESLRERFASADMLAPTAPATRSLVRAMKRSDEIASVVALLRQPKSARQVFIAASILGPPRALAE